MKRLREHAESHPTGAQLRAARGLLNLSVLELSEWTGLAVNTIKRAEASNAPAPINTANARHLVATLEEAGVRFIPAEGDLGAGVRLASPNQPALTRRRLGKKRS